MTNWNDSHNAAEVHGFWFGEIANGDVTDPTKRQRWFNSTPTLDAEISERFLPQYEQALAGKLSPWQDSAKGSLALVILLDQFPLNMFRGTRRAFESEQAAVNACLVALEADHPGQLSHIECTFLFMPLMHAESVDLQAESVRRFEALVDIAPDALKDQAERTAAFAREHRDTVVRFGRFPHRNAVLGRTDSPEEAAYLASDPARYGQ